MKLWRAAQRVWGRKAPAQPADDQAAEQPRWLVEVGFCDTTWYHASCPDLPGYFAWAKTTEAALAKYLAGLADYLECLGDPPAPFWTMKAVRERYRADPAMRFSGLFDPGLPQNRKDLILQGKPEEGILVGYIAEDDPEESMPITVAINMFKYIGESPADFLKFWMDTNGDKHFDNGPVVFPQHKW